MFKEIVWGLTVASLSALITNGITQAKANETIDLQNQQIIELTTNLETEKLEKQKYYDALQESAMTLEAKNILIEELTLSLDSTKTELTQAKLDLENKQKDLDAKQTELDNALAYSESLETQLAISENANEGYIIQLENLSSEINTLNNQITSLTSERDALQISVNELTEEVTALQNTITSLQEEMQILKNTYKIASASNFTFDGNTLTGYVGTATDFALPTSYSLADDGSVIDGTDFQITAIGENAFKSSNIQSVFIPDCINSIGKSAFATCKSLTSITLPSGLTKIEDNTFVQCTNLTNITIPEGVTTIGSCAFDTCSRLNRVELPASINTLETSAFAYISESATVYYNGTIENWLNISFESQMANPLYRGETIYINNSLVKNIDVPNSITELKDYSLYGFNKLETLNLPNTLTAIGKSALTNCSSLTSISIPENVTSIGSSAFSGCVGITELIIPSKVTTIGSSAFSGIGITSISIPEGVTTLEMGLFNNCASLTTVHLPSTITYINSSVFGNCTALKEITILAETPPTLKYANIIPITIETIYIPYGTLSAYQSATNWKTYSSKFVELEENGDNGTDTPGEDFGDDMLE